MADLVSNPYNQDRLAEAISERPELLFKAAEQHPEGADRCSAQRSVTTS